MTDLNLYAPQIAKKIAEANASGVSKAELARQYQVSTRTIGRVIDRFLNTPKITADAKSVNEDEVVRLFTQTGISKAELGRRFGVSSRTIGRIIDRNKTSVQTFRPSGMGLEVDGWRFVDSLGAFMAPKEDTSIFCIFNAHAGQFNRLGVLPEDFVEDQISGFSEEARSYGNEAIRGIIRETLIELIRLTKKVKAIMVSGSYTTHTITNLFGWSGWRCPAYGQLAESIDPENPDGNAVSLLANNLISHFSTRAHINGVVIPRALHASYVLRFVQKELEQQAFNRALLEEGLGAVKKGGRPLTASIEFLRDVCAGLISDLLCSESVGFTVLVGFLNFEFGEYDTFNIKIKIEDKDFDSAADTMVMKYIIAKDDWLEDINHLKHLFDLYLAVMSATRAVFVDRTDRVTTYDDLIAEINQTHEKTNHVLSKEELVRLVFRKTIERYKDDSDNRVSDADLSAYRKVLSGLFYTPEEIDVFLEETHPGYLTIVEEPPYTYEVISSSRFVFISRQDAKTGEIETVTQNVTSCTSTRSKFDALLSKAKNITGLDDPIIPELFASLKEIVSAERQINNLAIVNGLIPSALRIDPLTGHVYYGRGNSPIVFSGVLVDRILKAVEDQDYDILKKLTRFTERLGNNPRKDIVSELYKFLEASDIEIDDEGYVIAFKRVDQDFLDCYTRTFDNSPGKIVEVPRSSVDDDPKTTCSHGLHVCSKAYLPYYNTHGIVVKVKIDPEDFVSIPFDYYRHGSSGHVLAKARVCRYLVLSEEHGV